MFVRIHQLHVFVVGLLLTLILAAASPASAKTAAAKSADDTFQPDVYPSTAQASAHLAREIADALHCGYGNPDKVPPILVRMDSSTEPCPGVSDASDELARSLREEFGDRVGSSDGDDAEGAEHVVVTLSAERVTHNLPRGMSDTPWPSGTLIAQVASKKVNESFDAAFSQKPWVTNWAAFVNDASPGQRWFHAQSSKPGLTADEAEASARKAAAEQLAPFVRAQLSAPGGAAGRTITVLSGPQLTSSIETILRHDVSIVTDRFVQRFQRPYGTVWQAQLLMDGSPARIDSIARQISSQGRAEAAAESAAQRQHTREVAATGGSIFGLIVVIVLLYFFLNAATKGYFTGRLRAIAMLMMIVGAVALYGMLHTTSRVMIVPAPAAAPSVSSPATPAQPAPPTVSAPPQPSAPEPANDDG